MSVDQGEEFPIQSWDVWSCLLFRKTNEIWGGFSNMCSGYPIVVNGVTWLTSEALYQALRFPERADIQEIIRNERSPMAAKMKSKPYRSSCSRIDWDEVRVNAMLWCLAAKLIANEEKFGGLLRSSIARDVVEDSHKDRFWGAVKVSDDYLQGQNVLGVLIMRLRSMWGRDGMEAILEIRPPEGTLLLGASELVVSPSESEGQLNLF